MVVVATDNVPQKSGTTHSLSVPHSAAAIAGAANKLQLRKWLCIGDDGVTTAMELSKLRVHQQLMIPLRDLRLLDPMLAMSYSSAILARERALIVNLEFIKMIICPEKVFITNLDDPNTMLFVEELQRRLLSKSPGASTADLLHAHQAATAATSGSLRTTTNNNMFNNNNNTSSTTSFPHYHSELHHFTELSFELRVLECGLDVVQGFLEGQVDDLDAAAHPALEALTQKISTNNLERVRRVKNRMVRLTTRVETLREVLSALLDDDSDMKDLNLSAKEQEREKLFHRQSLRHSLSLSMSASTPFDVPIPGSGAVGGGGIGGGGGGIGSLRTEPSMPASMPSIPAATAQGALPGTTPFTRAQSNAYPPNDPQLSTAVDSSDANDDEAVMVVEQLLEAYYMAVDSSWKKIQNLSEYIEDCEDFINIELDSHRNQLIRLDLVLTAFTAAIAMITAVTSLFAMVRTNFSLCHKKKIIFSPSSNLNFYK